MGDLKCNVALRKKIKLCRVHQRNSLGPLSAVSEYRCVPQVIPALERREPGEVGAAAASMLPSEETRDKARESRKGLPASGLPAPADRRSRNALGPVCDRKRNGTAAGFPPAARPQRSSRVPARGRLPGPLPPRGTKRDRRAGRPSPSGSGQVEARTGRRSPPRLALGSVPPAPRTYQEKQQRALHAPRHRASAAGSPRPRARAGSSPAPPPRGSPPRRRPHGPAQRGGSRCGLREKMEPGARPSGSGRGGNGAEEGGARGTPAPRRTRTWSHDGRGLGTPNDRPRPAASPPRAPLRRGRPAVCAPGRRGDRALGGRARGPGGAEEKDERREDPCPPRVLRAACCTGQLSGSEGSGAGFRWWSP